MNIGKLIDIYSGGPGSGCQGPNCGRPSTGEGETPKVSDRAQRAIDSYVPVTREKYAIAKKYERKVAKIVGGTAQPDNSPFDVLLGKIGIEVKTVIEGKNNKITMHPKSGGGSLERKREFIKQNRLKKAFTVIIDLRGDKEKWMVKEGIGSFQFGKLPGLKSPNHLRMEIT